jgi:hypothetical protein
MMMVMMTSKVQPKIYLTTATATAIVAVGGLGKSFACGTKDSHGLGKILLCLCVLIFSQTASAQSVFNPMDLRIYPPTIRLDGARDSHQVIGQTIFADGITAGVTEHLGLTVADQAVARVENGRVYPTADGKTNLTVTYKNFKKEIPITVANSQADDALSFQLDVMPVFSKTGCNAGSCHGAARGKDGFRLSLFGYDAQGDYFRLTREMLGRRIDVALPDDCLLTNKATNRVAHSGGKLFDEDSDYYAVLKRWLEEGANFDGDEVATVASIELLPKDGLLNGTGANQRLNVTAHYSDQTTRDVTHLAFFSTSNSDVAAVSQEAVVTGGRRGEALVMARFDTHTVGAQFITLPQGLEFEDREDLYPENNFIDGHINAKLKKLRIYPSQLCTDAQFIRRVNIDICGQLPTVEEVNDFVADEDPLKRSALIDRLLDQDAFMDLWVMKWAELLQIRSANNSLDAKGAFLYFQWLREKFYDQTPLNQIVIELLSATGSTFDNPPTNFYEVDRDQLKTAENVAQVFLGMRIQCAQCHNHPFDRWTMEDYYCFAAFFAKDRVKPTSDPREMIVSQGGGKETKHPVTGAPMMPKYLGGDFPDVKGKDRRVVLADWIADPENPYFAKNVSNIVWAHFFGRGIVDEVDDVRISNPPVNAALWDALGQSLVKSNFNLKDLVRKICNSRTYQLSTQANESNASDLTNFSHASLRRMRAEVLLDVLAEVTDTQNKFAGLKRGSRATQIADGSTSNYFLKTFGRSARESVCSCEVKQEPNLSQALHLLNGDTVNKKIKSGNLVGKWQKAGLQKEEIVERLYLRTIARKPTEAELESVLAAMDEQEVDPENKAEVKAAEGQSLEDLFWALLNSSEFMFNH